MIQETIDLGDNWLATLVPMWVGPAQMQIRHRCGKLDKYGVTSAVVHRMIKNTHRRHGVRYRCQNCKTPAPKKVLLWLKLNKLYEKVT